jgi:hypothetical protein
VSDHEAVIEPDARGRVSVRKFLGHTPGARYRVYVDREAARITLELVAD